MIMSFLIFLGLLLPFAGTLLGCGGVFFMRGELSGRVRCALLGFSGGIMTAASVWSLLLPAIEYSVDMGGIAFLPAAVGFLLGMGFLMSLEKMPDKFGRVRRTKSSRRLVLAVGLHNIPEGMAVGAAFAGLLAMNTGITLAEAMGLAAGIAIQNIPEGAIVTMPVRAEGVSKSKAFLAGVLSGVVEPIGSFVTLYAVGMLLPILPYLLGFAAGAMIYVVINELVPEMSVGEYSRLGEVMFGLGFVLMMTLDVALG